MFATAGRGVQEQLALLEQEIADIERQIDAIEGDAIAGFPRFLAGSPQRLPALGKILFYAHSYG
jgi:hypothetical protein